MQNPPHSNGATVAAALAGVKRSRLARIYIDRGVMWINLTLGGLARYIADEARVSPLHRVYGRLLLSNTKTKLDSPRKLGTIFKPEKQEALYQEALHHVRE
jgi:hypothetical protein